MPMSRRGGLFDGRAARAIAGARGQSERDIANAARDHIRRELLVVPKKPTGYYRSQIRVIRANGGHQVSDSGVIYGPWLNGTGSRNYPVTRFKGYFFFRRASQKFRAAAGDMARRILGQYLGGI